MQYKTSAPAKLHGLRQAAIDAIGALEPYDGGKGADLSILNRLNRIDKHRLLVTVGSSVAGSNVGGEMTHLMREAVSQAWPGKKFAIPDLALFLAPADKQFDFKIGDQINVGAPNAPEKKQSDFLFAISLNEPGIVECKPLLETLDRIGRFVNQTILGFLPHLA